MGCERQVPEMSGSEQVEVQVGRVESDVGDVDGLSIALLYYLGRFLYACFKATPGSVYGTTLTIVDSACLTFVLTRGTLLTSWRSVG